MPVIEPAKTAKARTAATKVRRGDPQAIPDGSAYNRRFPRHSIHDTSGQTRLSELEVRQICESVGFTPTQALHMAQIAHGESQFYPGVVQDDPGDGNVGWGLWQITPHAWPAGSQAAKWLDELGGIQEMLNPVACGMMGRRLFLDGGYAPWHGTRYLDLSSTAAHSAGKLSDIDPDVGTLKVAVPYLFEAGTRRGQPEDWWDATGRLAEEVTFRRWAALNTLFFVSDDELRAAPPSLIIDGSEPWLLSRPTGELSPGRSVTEVSFRVLSERWGIRPGAVVMVKDMGLFDGRYLVWQVNDPLSSPESVVTLRRPVKHTQEPRPDFNTVSPGGGTQAGSEKPVLLNDAPAAAARYYAACQAMSDAGPPYSYGGGHGPPLSSLGFGTHSDCSSSTSICLYKAGLFGNRTTAIVSGTFATSWGVAGPGRYFTIYADAGHVFTRFSNGVEFNTAGHPGVSGPRMGKFNYPTSGMAVRHYSGL